MPVRIELSQNNSQDGWFSYLLHRGTAAVCAFSWKVSGRVLLLFQTLPLSIKRFRYPVHSQPGFSLPPPPPSWCKMVGSHSKLGYCIHVLTLIEYYNIFQIALFVPFAVLAGLEGKHYGEVRKEPVALRPPYSPYIWHGMINPLTTVCP